MTSATLVRTALIGVVWMSACKKNTEVEDVTSTALDPAPRATGAVPDDVVETLISRFSRVAFDTDSSTLTPESRTLLADNAALLKRWPQVRVVIEGHADERGTTEYNVALGGRRAATVARALREQGVAKNQVETVSYGEERPLDAAHGESAWSVNRRVEFLVISGAEIVAGTY